MKRLWYLMFKSDIYKRAEHIVWLRDQRAKLLIRAKLDRIKRFCQARLYMDEHKDMDFDDMFKHLCSLTNLRPNHAAYDLLHKLTDVDPKVLCLEVPLKFYVAGLRHSTPLSEGKTKTNVKQNTGHIEHTVAPPPPKPPKPFS